VGAESGEGKGNKYNGKKRSIIYPAAPMQIQSHITAFVGVNSGTEIASNESTL